MGFKNKNTSAKTVILFALLQLTGNSLFMASAQTGGENPMISTSNIEITGNKKTRDNIIFRELLFAAGKSYAADDFSKQVNQSRLNLLNTSLFNFVTIDTIPVTDTNGLVTIHIKISVVERWYIWPVPVLEITDRNFNAWWQTRDFTRINYGLNVKWHNFTGRMDELDAIIQFGKNRQLSLAYHNPYIDKNKRFGLGFETGYTNNRETGYMTRDDKLLFAFDPDGLFTQKYFALSSSFRKSIFTTHQLFAGISAYSFSDSLLALNPDYSYEGVSKPAFLSVYYKLKIDHRDIKYYPLKGWYFDMEVNKSGLGFSFEEPVNITWVKSTSRFYTQLAKRWYTGVSFIGKVSSKAWQPYFLIQGLGYSREYVRGYEYNVIDGKHFTLARSNVKFALVPERTHNIGFIPTPKFGLVHYALYLTAFADAAYVWQPQWIGVNNNLLPQTFLAGAGFGIDLVTYYDKVMRIEYAVNKSGKSGIFIHFIAGI